MVYYYLLVSFPTILFIAGIIWGIKACRKLPKDSIVSLMAYAVIAILSILLVFIFLFAIIKSPIIFLIFIVIMLLFINKTIKTLIKKIKERKILESIVVIAISSIVFLPIMPIANSRVAMNGETINFVRCKIHHGDWIEVRGSFDGGYECGFEKTIDGGKPCRTASDCTLDCVVDNPFSDLVSSMIEKRKDGYYYVKYEDRICQTHKRFLDGKTCRESSSDNEHKLSPKEIEHYGDNLEDGIRVE